MVVPFTWDKEQGSIYVEQYLLNLPAKRGTESISCASCFQSKWYKIQHGTCMEENHLMLSKISYICLLSLHQIHEMGSITHAFIIL